MDSSQSSDIFSSKCYDSDSNNMDLDSYDSLVTNLKASLCDTTCRKRESFAIDFTSLLEDCQLCISQSLNLITVLISETNIQKLSEYMGNAVTVLQMLSAYIKSLIESVSMECRTMRTFPTTTGQIIMTIFMHCKSSEDIYGAYLNSVEKELKDLFRTCHEFQLTYLMVLEKHFIFDLTEKEELEILETALYINLHIGEVVQTLDVKTMAEQWKGYMMICEKHAAYLSDKNVYQESTKLLSSMILNNINTATEENQEDKLIVRSMKITSFTIKILLKICNIFKQSKCKPYSNIVDLLISVYKYNAAYLETLGGKTDSIISLMTNNITNPTDLLLKELISDEEFLNFVINCDINKLRQIEEMLGLALLLVSIIKNVGQRRNETSDCKAKLINSVFNLLPHCYVWCSIGLKFRFDSQNRTVGLFEYLLIHCTGMALTMNGKEIAALERKMLEVLLQTDTISALFSSNLWIAIARHCKNKLFLYNQLLSLCQMYIKLENVEWFKHSPQILHLSYTISGLFELSNNEEKVKTYKRFEPLSQPALWTILKVKNLPIELQRSVGDAVVEKFRKDLQKVSSEFHNEESIIDLIHVTNLASTCSLHTLEMIEENVLCMWAKVCPQNLKFLSNTMDIDTLWYLELIESLVSLTRAMKYMICGKSTNIVKILHVISSITLLDNVDLNLCLLDILCELATSPIHDENKLTAGKFVTESFKNVLSCSNCIVRDKLFETVKRCNDKYLHQTMSSVVNGEYSLEEEWQKNLTNNIKSNLEDLKLELESIEYYKFKHICVEKKIDELCVISTATNSCNSNFDLADIDTLFENDSCSEPVCKKVKFDPSLVEDILNKLEDSVTSLTKLNKHDLTHEHRNRIKVVNNKLKDFVS